MKKRIHQTQQNRGSKTHVELLSQGLLVEGVQDILDLMATLRHQDTAEGILIREENITPEFFNLSTGLAGEVLQKASNYGFRIGILGDFDHLESKALQDFIRESNRYKQVVFGRNTEEILGFWL
jgi:hypothetical protein